MLKLTSTCKEINIESIFVRTLKKEASCIEDILLALDALYPDSKLLLSRIEELEKYSLLKYLIDNFENIMSKSYAKIAILLSQEILRPLLKRDIRLTNQEIEEMKDEIKKLDRDLYSLLFYIALREAYRLKSSKLNLLAGLSDGIVNIISSEDRLKPLLLGIYFYLYLYSRKDVYKEAFEGILNDITEKYRNGSITYVQICEFFNILYDIHRDLPINMKKIIKKISLIELASYIHNNYSHYVQEITILLYNSEDLIRKFYDKEDIIPHWIVSNIIEIYYVVRAKRIIETNSLILPCVNPLENISKVFMIPLVVLKLSLQLKYYLSIIVLSILRHIKGTTAIFLSVIINLITYLTSRELITLSITSSPLLAGFMYIVIWIISKISEKYSERLIGRLAKRIMNRIEEVTRNLKLKIDLIRAILRGVYLIK